MGKKEQNLLVGKSNFEIEYVKKIQNMDMAESHYHPFYEIYYQLSGERYYDINGIKYHVKQGDFVFVNKLNLHCTFSVNALPFERILINFKNNPALHIGEFDFVSLFTANNVVVHSGKQRELLEGLLFGMIEEKKQKRAFYELYLNTLLAQLLIHLERLASINRSDERNKNPWKSEISKVIQYVDKNFNENITLQHLCEKYFLNPSYISRSFHKATGLTFIDYLNIARVKRACELLLETKHSVSFIAQEVGYNNSTHFGRVFKHITGLTPLQYRKNKG